MHLNKPTAISQTGEFNENWPHKDTLTPHLESEDEDHIPPTFPVYDNSAIALSSDAN